MIINFITCVAGVALALSIIRWILTLRDLKRPENQKRIAMLEALGYNPVGQALGTTSLVGLISLLWLAVRFFPI